MTGKLGTRCKANRCPEFARKDSRFCEKHKDQEPKAFAQRRQERLDIYSTDRWQRLRKLKLHRNPICEVCNTKPAHAVHHVKQARLHPELQFDYDNLQSICHSCHAAESQREAMEAKRARVTGIGEDV